MRKRTILIRNIIIVLILGLTSISLYLSFFYLPQKGRSIIVDALSNETKRAVTIGNIYYNPFKGGVVLKNLSIYEFNAPHKDELINVKEASFSPIIIPSLKKITIVIPSLNIKSPAINVRLDETSKMNLMDPPLFNIQDMKNQKIRLVIYKLKISNGTILFEDRTKDPIYKKIAKDISADVSLSIPSAFKIRSSFTLNSAFEPKFNLTVKYLIKEKLLESKLKFTRLSICDYEPYYLGKLPIEINNTIISSDLNLSLDKSKLLHIKGKSMVDNCDILKDKARITGNSEIGYELKAYLGELNNANFRIHSSLKNVSISNLDYPPDIYSLAGDIEIDNKSLLVKGIEFKIMDNKFNLKGSLKDFKNPILDFEGRTDHFNLTNLWPLLPQAEKNKFEKIKLGGFGDIKFRFSGSPKNLSLAKFLVNVNLKNASIDNFYNSVSIDGLEGTVESNESAITTKKLSGKIMKSPFDLEGNLTNYKNPNLKISGKIDKFNLSGIKQILNQDFSKTLKDYEFSGLSDVNFKFQGSVKDPKAGKFLVTGTLKEASITGLKYPGNLSLLNGSYEINESGIRIPRLKGNLLDNPFVANINFEDFSNPSLHIDAKIPDFDLKDTKKILPDKLKKAFNSIELSGLSSLDIKFDKLLNDDLSSDLEASIGLRKALLKNQALDLELKDVEGDVNLKNNELALDKISFIWADNPYTLNLRLFDFSEPIINFYLSGKDLSIKSSLTSTSGGNSHLEETILKFKSSHMVIMGDIQNIRSNPDINLYIKGNVHAEDTGIFSPKIQNFLDKTKLKGNIEIDSIVSGPVKNTLMLEIGLKASSDNISVYGLNGRNFYMNLRMKNKVLEIPHLSLNPYDGVLLTVFALDLSNPLKPYTIDLKIDGVNVNKLVADTTLKEKKISGDLSSKFAVAGNLLDLDSIRGSGWIHIKNGYLWEIPVVRGIGQALLLRGFEKVIFDEAGGDFTIEHKFLETNNLKLWSNQVVLTGEGSLDFSGNIDLDVSTSIMEGIIDEEQDDFKQLTKDLLREAGQIVGNMKITGPISKPDIKIKPMVGKYFKDKFREFIKGVLE